MFSGIGSRCASGALLVVAIGALLLAACNSSNPVAPAPPPPTGGSAFVISLSAKPSTLATGSNTPSTISVSVRRSDNGQAPPDGTSVSVNTSLGSLGTDGAGNPITITTVRLAGGTAQVSLFPGTATGTAQVLAQVEQSTGQVAVPIRTVTPPPFFLSAIAPNFGNAAGGQQVTITGSGFVEPVRVTFGGVVARTGTVTATSVQATVPRSTTPVDEGMTRSVDVEVTNALGQTSSTSDKLTGAWTYSGGDIEPPLAVFSVTPASGPTGGGTNVRIIGTGFEPPVQVFFGLVSGGSFQGLQATVKTGTTSTQINAVSPNANGFGISLANQLVSVQVLNVNTGQSAIGSGLFFYNGPGLVVTSMSPLSGPYTGGTPVTIRGGGFDSTGRFQVQFGGSVQTLTSISSDGSQLNVTTVPVAVSNCQPPSGTLTVTRLDTGVSIASPLSFAYIVPTPSITSLSPASGPQGGGTAITAQGSGFDTQVRATVNGVAATVSSAQPSAVAFTAPAFTGTFETETCTSNGMQGTRNKPKAVDVVISNTATGCADTLPQSYTYQPSDTSCVVPPPAKPKADFTVQIVDTTVQFMDASTNSPTSYLWDFGEPASGGANLSFQTNPSHVYTVAPGQTMIFSVSLTVTNDGGSDTAVKLISVTAPAPPPT